MAARKKVESDSKAVANTAATDMTTIEEQLAQEMAGIQGQIGLAATNKIKTGDKVFTFPDGTVDPGPIQVVILDFITKNKLYEGKYDASNPQPPVCFSIGKTINDLTPSANSLEAQADSCSGCPMNEFGSDGNGKACKNTRVLAVMAPDAAAGDDVMTIEVSPTALKGFDAYVSTVARLYNKPPIAVVTEVSFDQNSTWPKLVFSDPQPNANLPVHFAKRAEAQEMLATEPDMSNAEAPQPKRKTARRRRRVA